MPPSEENLVAVLTVAEWYLILNALETVCLLPLVSLKNQNDVRLLIQKMKQSPSLLQSSESVNRPNK